MAANKKAQQQGDLRLVCTLPNAALRISGIAFATVLLGEDEAPLHLSERIDAAQAEPFLACDGFAAWEGDEATHARAIEDALDAGRHLRPAGSPRGSSAAESDLQRQVDELGRANRAQSADLRTAAARIRELEAANTTLTTDLAALQATGARIAA
ncbi:MAG: hypothetical protein ABI629_10400 [bacterium]